MIKTTNKLIKFGFLTILLSSILGIIALILLPEIPKFIAVQSWIELIDSNIYSIANYILIYAYIIAIPGFWAIFRCFAISPKKMVIGFLGLILAIFGSAVPLIAIGINTFVFPALIKSNIHNLEAIRNAIFNSETMIFLLLSGMYYFIGILLLSLIIFRKKLLNILTSSLLILHALLIIMPEQFYINLMSWICLFVSSVLLIIIFKKYKKGEQNAA